MTTTSPSNPGKGAASKASDRIAFFPRLSRFYGLSFDELAALPRAILRTYIDAMPALEAEEQMARLQAACAPYADDASSARLRRILLRLVESGPEEHVEERDPADYDPAKRERVLGAMGIKVVTDA